jgi:hypothetical protein
VREVAEELSVPFADAYPLVVRQSANGIPGYDEFTDSVHPMPATNRSSALAIIETLRRDRVIPALQDDREAMAAAENEVRGLLRNMKPPEHNRMLKAILDGKAQEAVEIGRAMPERVMIEERTLEPLYYGWALTRSGRMGEARALHDRLRAHHWRRSSVAVPSLDTDEDIIRNAFAGDVFAWF